MAKKNIAKEKEVQKNMDILGITREEAEELWLFDHDQAECAEVEELEQKQKEKEKPKGSSLDKVRHMKAKKKADGNKEAIFAHIFENIGLCEVVKNPEEITASKISFMDKDGNYYSISLTKHKAKPDGYKGE